MQDERKALAILQRVIETRLRDHRLATIPVTLTADEWREVKEALESYERLCRIVQEWTHSDDAAIDAMIHLADVVNGPNA